jgi:YgiT-type zinc finger domain-containing protein
METKSTELPFKVGESAIVIIKDLPVIQCPQCSEYVLSDQVMMRVENILASINKGAESEIVRYAA